MTNKLSKQEVSQYNSKNIKNRDINIFTGICIGMLCDGHVNETELSYLASWISNNPHIANEYPVSKISSRINLWLRDGKIDEHEEMELLKILTSIAEPANTPEHEPVNTEYSLSDIFCTPEPDIFIQGARLSFTGDFNTDRPELEKIVVELGASIAKKEVSGTTDFLVVGESPSESWIHKTGGTKIVKALELKNRGAKIKIVREAFFMSALTNYVEKNFSS